MKKEYTDLLVFENKNSYHATMKMAAHRGLVGRCQTNGAHSAPYKGWIANIVMPEVFLSGIQSFILAEELDSGSTACILHFCDLCGWLPC